jgi:hypothetical protein
MAGLVPAIRDFFSFKAWMPGTKPGVTGLVCVVMSEHKHRIIRRE